MSLLIAGYMLAGAALFTAIEGDSRMELAAGAERLRNETLAAAWAVTSRHNVLQPGQWKHEIQAVLHSFQQQAE